MTRETHSIAVKIKAVLCIALTFNLCVWTLGCGQVGNSLFAGEQTISLLPDDALTQQLAGSAFEGATAIKVDASGNQFRLVFPDERQLSGTFTSNSGTREIAQLIFRADSTTVTMNFNNKAITDVSTSAGTEWQRPAEWNTQAAAAPSAPTAPTFKSAESDTPSSVDPQLQSSAEGSTYTPTPRTPKDSTSEVEAYMQANAQLLALAADLDEQGVEPGDDGAKVSASSFAWGIATLAYLFWLPGGILATIIWVFQIVDILT